MVILSFSSPSIRSCALFVLVGLVSLHWRGDIPLVCSFSFSTKHPVGGGRASDVGILTTQKSPPTIHPFFVTGRKKTVLFYNNYEDEEDEEILSSSLSSSSSFYESSTAGPWKLYNDFPLFLNQCTLQSFMFLLKTMKDPETIRWLDNFTQPVIRTKTTDMMSLVAPPPPASTPSSPLMETNASEQNDKEASGTPPPSDILSKKEIKQTKMSFAASYLETIGNSEPVAKREKKPIKPKMSFAASYLESIGNANTSDKDSSPSDTTAATESDKDTTTTVRNPKKPTSYFSSSYLDSLSATTTPPPPPETPTSTNAEKTNKKDKKKEKKTKNASVSLDSGIAANKKSSNDSTTSNEGSKTSNTTPTTTVTATSSSTTPSGSSESSRSSSSIGSTSESSKDRNLGGSRLLSYHGVGIINTTLFPTWESYWEALLEQPKQVYTIDSGAASYIPSYEIEMNPASICTRMISVRNQIAKEFAFDLGMVAKVSNDTIQKYYDGQNQKGGLQLLNHDDEEEVKNPSNSKTTKTKLLLNDEDEDEDYHENCKIDPSSAMKQGQRPTIQYETDDCSFLGFNPDPTSPNEPSPLRKGNWDLLLSLTTQESIHRLLNNEQDMNTHNHDFLRDFYVQRIHSHFYGSQKYNRARDFIEELFTLPPKMMYTNQQQQNKDGEDLFSFNNDNDHNMIMKNTYFIDPSCIAELVLKEREKVALEWQQMANQVQEQHSHIQRLQLTKLMESYNTGGSNKQDDVDDMEEKAKPSSNDSFE